MKVAMLIALIAIGPAGPAGADGARPVPVGVARVDITPDGPILLSGYQARGLVGSKGVQQPISAVAMAIGSDEGGASVLVAVDNLGIPDAMTGELADRLNRRAGIARERLAVGSTHTHSAPCLPGVAPNIFARPIPPEDRARIDRYARDLTDKLERACLDALKDRRPATLAWGRGKVDFARNRRAQGGPVDHSLPMLRAVDPDGKLRAVVVGYACHCTTLDPKDYLVSGDWAADAREAIEADHPGARALVLIGCGADSNPKDRPGREVARRHGRAIGDEVARLLKGPLTPLNVPPAGKVARVKLPFDTLPTRDELTALVARGGSAGYNASTQLARLDRGEPLQAELDYVVQAWHFGDDLAIVFLAGEVVVDYALRIGAELDPARTWVAAYANDVPCYIPSERILREGGYEGGGAMVYYGRPARLRPGVEGRIIAAVRDLVPPGFAAPKVAGRGEDDLARELPRIPPTGAAEALKTFRIHPGFRLELAASEPLVRSPVAASYDADGRLYVVEMRGYPYPEPRPTGGVSLLEDRDGDGRFDHRAEFVDGLSWPTGITPHDGGVFIASAPDILYAKDTDGDGRADVRRVMFTGFGTQNVQGLVNGLLPGNDGWIYGSSGSNGGEIRTPGRPDAPAVSVRGRDFRFRPDGSAFEAISGGGQFGHSLDDRGHRFVCMNSNHIRQVVLPARELARNPALAAPSVAVDIAADGGAGPVFRISSAEPWRVVRTRQRAADPAFASKAAPSELHAAGFFTSATGVTIYRGSAFPPEYRGNAFVGDVGGNLVHRKTLEEQGPTFLARRADEGVEFLASTDNWSRPVNFANTPSGTLLVLDMYRETIEHPASIPEPIKKHLDLTGGRDRGRLYEVVPDGFRRRPAPRLAGVPSAGLVAHLADPDAWWREAAQRLLIERADPAAIPLLKELARSRPTPLARIHAFWTLDALGGLDGSTLRPGLLDDDPGVREQAAGLAGPRADQDPPVLDALLARADDPSGMVRFRAALALGDVADPRAIVAMASIARRDAGDRWTRVAILSSIAGRTPALIEALSGRPDFFDSAPGREWLGDLAAITGAENRPDDIRAFLDRFAGVDAPPGRALAAILGLGRGLRRSGGSPAGAMAGRVAPLFDRAAIAAASADATLADRVDAIRLTALGPAGAALRVLPGLLDAREPSGVQVAALQGLTDLADPRVGPAIVGRWRSMGPAARREAAEVLFARPDRLGALLDAVESRSIAPAELDPARRKLLVAHPDPTIRGRSAALLADPGRPDGAASSDRARKVLELGGDPGRGREAFLKSCATCHRAGGLGVQVGPDLATVAGRTPEDLLLHILDPNREVAANYLNYTVATTDGRTFSGLIAEESAGDLTLKRAEGTVDVIPRARIEEVASTGLSLMPEGLDRDLGPRDLADLIAFIRSLGEGPPSPPRSGRD